MAKKTKGQGRLRVFFAEFEGDDETIQEGLRAISTAVSKTFQPTIIKIAPAIAGNGAQEDQEAIEEELADYEDDGVVDAVASRPRSQKTRKPPSMSIVKDLDLQPSDKQSLRDFYSAKMPKTFEKQVAVFVHYLQRELELEGISANHVFTCFKNVDARRPTDLPQIIRNTGSRQGWVDGSDANAITITNLGENFVEHDLPETGKNGD